MLECPNVATSTINFLKRLFCSSFYFIYSSYRFVPESPRWLYLKNRHEKADVIVKKIAKFNDVDIPEKLNVEVTVCYPQKKPINCQK